MKRIPLDLSFSSYSGVKKSTEEAHALLDREEARDPEDRAPFVHFSNDSYAADAIGLLGSLSGKLNLLDLPLSIDLTAGEGEDGVLFPAACLQPLASLTSLSLQSFALPDGFIHNMFSPDKLEELALSKIQNIPYADLAVLQGLKKLGLSLSHPGSDTAGDVAAIQTLMPALQQLRSLSLELVNVADFDLLMAFLDHAEPPKLTELKVHLGVAFTLDKGQVQRLGAVIKAMPHLKQLDFSWGACVQFPDTMAQLIRCFGASEHIEELVLSGNNFASIDCEDNVRLIADAIGACQKVKAIDLSQAPGPGYLKHVQCWAKGIAKSSSATEVSLRRNHFPTMLDLKTFIEFVGLKIEALDLSDCYLEGLTWDEPEAFSSVMAQIAQWPALHTLNLSATRCFHNVAPLRLLGQSTSLNALDFDYSGLGAFKDEALSCLASFPALTSLEAADLFHNTASLSHHLAAFKTLRYIPPIWLSSTDEDDWQAITLLSQRQNIEVLCIPDIFASEEVTRVRHDDFPTDDDAANGLVQKVRRTSAMWQERLLKYAPFWVKGQFSSQLQAEHKLNSNVIEHIYSFFTEPVVPPSESFVLTVNLSEQRALLQAFKAFSSRDFEEGSPPFASYCSIM